MALTARCVLCGKLIERDAAYAVVKAGKRKYYCSKEEFDGGIEYVEKRKEYEDETERAVKKLMSKSAFDPVYYNTCYNQWLQMVPPEVLHHYITNSSEVEKILVALNGKNFTSAKGELAYISAIIKRRITTYAYTKQDCNKKTVVKIPDAYDEYMPRLEPRKNMRRSLVDLEGDL